MGLVIAAVLVLVGIPIVARFGGGYSVAAVLVLAMTALYPKTLVSATAVGIFHVGISTPAPTITSYAAVLAVLAFLFLLRSGVPRSMWLWMPFVTWCVVALCFGLWPGSEQVWSGIDQLALGPLAWWVGAEIGRHATQDGRVRSAVLWAVSVILIIQFVVCLLQAVGLPINPMSAASEAILSGRTNGTLVHPDDLGKVVLLLIAVVLPLFSRESGVRLTGMFYLIMGSALGTLLLTQGRAVLIGAAASVILWILVQPNTRKGVNRKVLVLGFSAVAGLLIWMALAARFLDDPTGGSRSSLNTLALSQIALRPWFGTAPNSYVSVVGQFDALTASGVPVHNTFLLAAGELGIPGALALGLPFVVAVVRTFGNLSGNDQPAARSRALLAVTPALILIGATGWGLLGSEVYPLLAFTFGWLAQGRSAPRPDASSVVHEQRIDVPEGVIGRGLPR